MLAATLLALGSAAVHASWNLLIKTSSDRAVAAWGQFLAAAVLSTVGLLVIGAPGWIVLPNVVATAAIHVIYVESLVAAYTHGDFSLSYPLARGGGAVLAAIGSVVLLGDHLTPLAVLAIAVAGAGLIALGGGRSIPAADDVILGTLPDDVERPRSGDLVAIGFAVLTAVCIAAYTLVDSAGARDVESGVSYGLTTVAASGFAICLSNLVRSERRSRAELLRIDWHRHVAGGAGTVIAYTMVLVAVRTAPVGYVTMLRESSVVIGALLGWLLLREALGKRRLICSAVILAGLVLLVVAEL